MSEEKSKTFLTVEQKRYLEKSGWEFFNEKEEGSLIWFGADYENLPQQLLEIVSYSIPSNHKSQGADFLVVAFRPDYMEEDVEDE